MQLPRGITGFCMSGDPPLPATDIVAFKALAYAAARLLNASVVRCDTTPDPARSFHIITLQTRETRYSLLGHTIHPVVAWTLADAMRFIDMPALVECAHEFGFQTYPAAFLDTPLDPAYLTNLAPVERREIKSWRPQRMGDVIFNFWD